MGSRFNLTHRVCLTEMTVILFYCISQVMKGKQSALLSQLDALDEECGNLREELAQVESTRQELASNLQQVQAQYKQVEKQLGNEQV